jgi:hypothetical protein
MKQISGAQIRVKDNEVQVRGSCKQVLTAKSLLTELKNNYSRGVFGLTSTSSPKKVQKRFRVRTDTSSGWSTVEANKTEESSKPEPKKVSVVNNSRFAGLDFDSDDEDVDEIDEFPALPSSQHIRLVVKEKEVPDSEFTAWISKKKAVKESNEGMSWADICDEED